MAVGSDPNTRSETNPDPADPAELVHETRKAIKRMRALSRMLRYELGEQEFKRIDNSMRDAGQRLAGARDAEVRLATLESLRTRYPKALDGKAIERLHEQLEREREQASGPASLDEVLEDIADMRRALAHLNLVDPDLQTLAPGLERIYREGRRHYARVKRGHNDPEQVHDWRKRVKALYYSLDMVGGLHVKGVRRAARRAGRLGDLLGEEHDLWMLCVYVEGHSEIFGEEVETGERLLKQIERRRVRLHKRALELGTRLYRRKPAIFTRRTVSALSR